MTTLSAEQARVRAAVLRDLRRDPFVTLGGFAGTGKSTVLAELHRALPRFAVCCFTGKAADVLRRKGIATAQTIHSLIYSPQKIPGGGVEFVLKDARRPRGS
jgi:exodeoxyribonuclease-5